MSLCTGLGKSLTKGKLTGECEKMVLFIWEEIKEKFWYFFGMAGVVFFWAGVWDGLGYLPYLENPWLSIVLGTVMLALSQFLFREPDPEKKAERKMRSALHKVRRHPRKHEFHIRYHDKLGKKDFLLRGDKLKDIEKGFLLLHEKGKEIFVPIHRVREILHKGKTFLK